MATTITIDYDDDTVTVHVTDSTGRDQTATTRRYPDPQSAAYVRMVDALDVLMYEHDNARVCDHISPRCGTDHRTGDGFCGLT